jgi:hypothetical protein
MLCEGCGATDVLVNASHARMPNLRLEPSKPDAAPARECRWPSQLPDIEWMHSSALGGLRARRSSGDLKNF